MYKGLYYHRIDEKNRVSIPAKFREQIGKGAIVTRGLDGCLVIYDAATWEKELSKLQLLAQTKKAHRQYIRFLTHNAQELEIDSHGRFLLQDELKTSVGITKEVVFAGTLDHIEMWSQETYHDLQENESEIEDLVEGIETVERSV